MIKFKKEHLRHPISKFVYSTDAYKEPDSGEWDECPRCHLKPLIWVFNNGKQTVCGCATSKYDHWSIHAESICSILKRKGSIINYYVSDLRNNWNHYCRTGQIVFSKPQGGREDGRW